MRQLACCVAFVSLLSATPALATTVRPFTVTAYCQHGITKSGAHTRPGVAAADPRYVPLGSVVHVDAEGAAGGTYTILDTGSKVKGWHIDLYSPDCARAKQFGRQRLLVTVLRRGWGVTSDALFRRH